MRMPSVLYNLLLIFLIVLVVNQYNAKADNQVNSIKPDILVKNEVIKTLPDDYNFIGANWQAVFFQNQEIFSNPQHIDAFIKILKDIGINIIRYPGGENVAYTFWDVPNEILLPAVKKWKASDKEFLIRSNLKPADIIDFYSFLRFCRKAGIKATVQVNTHAYFDSKNGTIIPLKSYSSRDIEGKRIYSSGKVDYDLVEKAAQYAADEVKWVKDNNYSDVVKFWELGNEEFVRVGSSSVYSGEEYGKIAAIFIRKMKEADPDIKFILTNQMKPAVTGESPVYMNAAFQNDWSKEVLNIPELKAQASSIFAVASHAYFDGNTNRDKSYQAFYDNAMNNQDIDLRSRLSFHKKVLDNLGYKNMSIFVNEFNSSNFKSKYTHTWTGSLGNARMMLSCAASPSCTHMDYFNLLHGYWIINDVYANKGFEMLHYAGDFQMPFISHPVGNVVKLLNKHIKGKVLNTITKIPNIIAAASDNGDNLNVIILNTRSDKHISLKLSGFSNVKYIKNESLGIGVPDNFTVLDTGDSASNPSEARLLNTLNDAVEITQKNTVYEVNLPGNTLVVLTFKKQG